MKRINSGRIPQENDGFFMDGDNILNVWPVPIEATTEPTGEVLTFSICDFDSEPPLKKRGLLNWLLIHDKLHIQVWIPREGKHFILRELSHLRKVTLIFLSSRKRWDC